MILTYTYGGIGRSFPGRPRLSVIFYYPAKGNRSLARIIEVILYIYVYIYIYNIYYNIYLLLAISLFSILIGSFTIYKQHQLCVVFFLVSDSPASEFYVPTFRNTLFHLYRRRKQEKQEYSIQNTAKV
jgi:hypothetical protein